MTAKLRDYRAEDLSRCMELVNDVWDFDGNIGNPEMATFVKDWYVNGSLVESRHFRVAEDDGEVVGLLFGACGPGPLFDNGLRSLTGVLRLLWRFLRTPGWGLGRKWEWLRAARAHDSGRRGVLPTTKTEITLLAVDSAAQGRGIGRLLMDEYIAACRHQGESQITVETDLHSNFGFYEHYGFVRIGTFHSPMTLLFAGDAGDTFVYVLDL